MRARPRRTLAVLVVAALALLVGVPALLAAFRPGPSRIAGVTTVSPDPLHIGQPVACTITLQLPWFRTPGDVQIDHSDAVRPVGDPRCRLAALGWTTWRWKAVVRVQPLQAGELNPGTVRFALPSNDAEPDAVSNQETVSLPTLTVTARSPDVLKDVHVAASLDDPPGTLRRLRRWWPLGVGLLTALGIGAAWFLLRRRSGGAAPRWIPPPHDRALAALQELQAALPVDPEPFYVRVTDVLRAYIEERFQIRAAEQTTPEFLRSMARRDDVDPAHAERLQEFMTAADRVKFARQSADQSQLRDSLRQARQFVVETAPPHVEDSASSSPS